MKWQTGVDVNIHNWDRCPPSLPPIKIKILDKTSMHIHILSLHTYSDSHGVIL